MLSLNVEESWERGLGRARLRTLIEAREALVWLVVWYLLASRVASPSACSCSRHSCGVVMVLREQESGTQLNARSAQVEGRVLERSGQHCQQRVGPRPGGDRGRPVEAASRELTRPQGLLTVQRR